MRLHERDRKNRELLGELSEDILALRVAIATKTVKPYGDGSCSNMVNVDTDVYPALEIMAAKITYTGEALLFV